MNDLKLIAKKECKRKAICSLKEKYADVIENWLESDKIVEVNYPDITEQIIDKILKEQLGS